MTEKNAPVGVEKDAGSQETGKKKPYLKPEFRFEKVFETLALACGKMQGQQGQCRFNRKRS
jgi:hypothetical protein